MVQNRAILLLYNLKSRKGLIYNKNKVEKIDLILSWTRRKTMLNIWTFLNLFTIILKKKEN